MGHIKGPWEAVTNPMIPYIQIIGDALNARKSLGKIAKGYETSEADARLIAAAPDLLEACKLAARHLCELAPMPPDVDESTYGDRRAVNAIRAAIAKASGGAA